MKLQNYTDDVFTVFKAKTKLHNGVYKIAHLKSDSAIRWVVFYNLLIISMLTACNCSQTFSNDGNAVHNILPESVVMPKLESYPLALNSSKCDFVDPDTSVAGIKLRHIESALKVLGQNTKLEGDSIHVFYSNDKKQKLGLMVYPGDIHNQVSVFYVSYTGPSEQNCRSIDSKEFETEKGIKLGMSKRQIIEKLGSCYTARDSSTNRIDLFYRLKLPKDSRTKLLTTHKLPSYYAVYRLLNDQLENFEFGFEYP